MIRFRTFGIALAVACSLGGLACSSSDDGGGGAGDTADAAPDRTDAANDLDGGHAQDSADAADAADTGTDSSDSGSEVLAAPDLDTPKPMDGSLHITWTNVQTDCDTIEGERKDGLHPYAVVFSVSGTLDNTMDTGATGNMNYTYRLRCKKGAAYSPYSNEESANPLGG